MLLKFAIQERSFEELAKLNGREQHSAMQSFLTTWEEMGLLVKTDSLTDADLLFSAFRKAPKPLQKSLKNILVGRSRRQVVVRKKQHDLTGCTTTTEVESYRSDLDVYLVDDSNGDAYGIQKTKTSSSGELPERCIFRHLVNSDRLAHVRNNNANRRVAVGADTRELYEEYFQDHVRCSDKITIVDRFCLSNQFESSSIGPTGLENLLSWIYQDNHLASMTIISRKVGQPKKTIENWVQSLRPGDAPAAVIHMLPDTAFSQLQHDRYIRLARDVLALDRGVQVFNGASTTRTDKFNCHFDKNSSYSSSETELLRTFQHQLQTLAT